MECSFFFIYRSVRWCLKTLKHRHLEKKPEFIIGTFNFSATPRLRQDDTRKRIYGQFSAYKDVHLKSDGRVPKAFRQNIQVHAYNYWELRVFKNIVYSYKYELRSNYMCFTCKTQTHHDAVYACVVKTGTKCPTPCVLVSFPFVFIYANSLSTILLLWMWINTHAYYTRA